MRCRAVWLSPAGRELGQAGVVDCWVGAGGDCIADYCIGFGDGVDPRLLGLEGCVGSGHLLDLRDCKMRLAVAPN